MPEAGRADAIDLAGIPLEHPVLNASGTFDALAAVDVFGEELLGSFPFSAFVTKTVTVEPRAGNAMPRIWETASGIVNSVGLPNPGLESFLRDTAPRLGDLPVRTIVSIAGFREAEWRRLVSGVAPRPEVSAMELNVSCPNVKSGCVYGSDPAEVERLLGTVRPLTAKPIIVKLTPNASRVSDVALAAEASGADAVSLINTVRATALRPDGAGRRFALGTSSGGLSGPAVKPIALHLVAEVSSRVRVPVIGMGGITSGQDALDFLRAGATAVAVGTESFRDPLAGRRVASELRYLTKG